MIENRTLLGGIWRIGIRTQIPRNPHKSSRTIMGQYRQHANRKIGSKPHKEQ